MCLAEHEQVALVAKTLELDALRRREEPLGIPVEQLVVARELCYGPVALCDLPERLVVHLVQAGEVSRALLARLRDLAPTSIFPAPAGARATGTRRSTEIKSRPAAARKPAKKAATRKPATKAAPRKRSKPAVANAPKPGPQAGARKRAASRRRKPATPT